MLILHLIFNTSKITCRARLPGVVADPSWPPATTTAANTGHKVAALLGTPLIRPAQRHTLCGQLIAGLQDEELGEAARQEGLAGAGIAGENEPLVLGHGGHLALEHGAGDEGAEGQVLQATPLPPTCRVEWFSSNTKKIDNFARTCAYTVLYQLVLGRVGNSLFGFSSESPVFCERNRERAIRSGLLFCKEQQERFAHGPFFNERQERFSQGRSFVKSDESKSLTVTLF